MTNNLTDTDLGVLKKIIAHNKAFSLNENEQILTANTGVSNVLIYAFVPMCILLNIVVVWLELGILPILITLFISIALIAVLFLRTKDYVSIDFNKQIVETRSMLILKKTSFNQIHSLNIIEFNARQFGTALYKVVAQTDNGQIGLFFDKSLSVCTEMLNWFSKFCINKAI